MGQRTAPAPSEQAEERSRNPKTKRQHALPKEESKGKARREIQEAQVEEVHQGAGACEEEVVVKVSPPLRVTL